jgi:hypothetical protein
MTRCRTPIVLDRLGSAGRVEMWLAGSPRYVVEICFDALLVRFISNCC